MEFMAINQESKVYPGEYLLHVPSKTIVVCGAFMRSENKIKALKNGQLITEHIKNFQKIKMSPKEKRERKYRSCGGCKKR
jgi:hypothetical protein